MCDKGICFLVHGSQWYDVQKIGLFIKKVLKNYQKCSKHDEFCSNLTE